MPELLRALEGVVRERGAATAVVASDAMLSFAALEAEARRLADRLRAAGVRQGDVVALSLGRSAAHVVGMLAAWYAGAAFLPIDPAAPADRVRAMLDEARARAVLAAPAPPTLSPADRIAIERLAGDRPPLGAPGDDLAYVIYTSGSTGRPKGVRLAHRGLCPVLFAQIRAFGLCPGKRALLYLSTAFDASISDIGTALLSGAALVIPDEPPAPLALAARLRADAITHADLPPSILPLVDPGSLPPCLETVVIGGDVCAAPVVRGWAGRVRVVNVYGPTEATICTSFCVCDAMGWTRPLLGEPLDHVEYEVEGGELLIAGPALALGYVDRPELEARRFVTRGGKRWYRTGDLVRYGGGVLEFLGRADRQIKLRGLLVCPEEIESHLRALDGVADAVVALEASPGAAAGSGRARLVARVEAATGAALSASALQRDLAAVLPTWMVPRIEIVGSLARGATGKVDRCAAAPRAPIADRRTRAIAEAFEHVLGAPDVGEDDDAVALGADSLAALEIAATAQLAGVAVQACTVLAERTPAAIARAPITDARTVGDLEVLAERLTDGYLAPGAAGCGVPSAEWFITGATGFLGRRLLRELLSRAHMRSPGAPDTVHCLVRAASDGEAQARLGDLAGDRRVVAHAGDVSAPHLGMGRERWEALARRVGHVVHASASLSLARSLESLDATNVRGALEVARFACAGAPKTVHHVSSLAVLASTDHPAERLDERATLRRTTRVFGPYAQTKWLAEAVLRRTVRDLRVIRPGLLTGDSATGESSPSCPLASFLRAVVALGCLPVSDDDRLRVDVTPIDRAARAIADVLVLPRRVPVVHVASERGASLADLVRALRSRGPLERVARDDFLRRARDRLSRETALAFVASAFRLLDVDAHRDADLFLHTGRVFPGAALDELTGRRMPPIDDDLLLRYVQP
jgi:nonribosomal peptide synthetase DhbF